MEEQPRFEPEPAAQAQPWGFMKRLGRVLAVSMAAAVLYALAFGPQSLVGFVNGLFWVGAILLSIALLPMFSDAINRSTMTMRAKEQSLEEIMQERSEQGDTYTFLFGVSGMIIVVLSFIIGFV